MWVTATLSSSTFKPTIDRCMAADGTDVILWATDRLLVRLAFRDGSWQITRHAATHPSNDVSGRRGAFCWYGRFYIEQGEAIAALASDTPQAEWERLYMECAAFAEGGGSLAAAS